MWDPPRPGLEPVSPALAGRFSTTAPPGKPLSLLKKDLDVLFIYFIIIIYYIYFWLRLVLVEARRLFVEAHRLFVLARGLLSRCGVWVPERIGSVVCGTRALVEACKLSSCGA